MYYVGIDVGGTNLVAGLVDREGSILRKAGVPVDKSLDGAGLCRQLVRLAVEVCREEGWPWIRSKLWEPAFRAWWTTGPGVVVQTANMPFRDTPVRQLFQQEWDVPFFLGNDANCAAIGEYWPAPRKAVTRQWWSPWAQESAAVWWREAGCLPGMPIRAWRRAT